MTIHIHLVFDILAYGVAFACAFHFRRLADRSGAFALPAQLKPMYFFVLTNGVIFGSLILGSANIWLAGTGPAIGKSILGAIVGGIVAVELFKRHHRIRGSTGAALVPALALGIFVGRWGCFLAGLDDFTYGIPSSPLPGIDFGDGIDRHPVQLYEGFAMACFFVVAALGLHSHKQYWWRNGFYYFAIVYGVQRFLWEFLKPYPRLPFGLNLFQLLCIGLIIYGVVMLRERQENANASQIA